MVKQIKANFHISIKEAVLRDLVLSADHIYLYQNEYPKFSTDVPERNLRFAHQFIGEYPTIHTERLAPLLKELRVCKEPEEVEMMRKACDITKQAFSRVLNYVKPGVFEYQVEAEIVHEFLRNGSQGHAYAGSPWHYNQSHRTEFHSWSSQETG